MVANSATQVQHVTCDAAQPDAGMAAERSNISSSIESTELRSRFACMLASSPGVVVTAPGDMDSARPVTPPAPLTRSLSALSPIPYYPYAVARTHSLTPEDVHDSLARFILHPQELPGPQDGNGSTLHQSCLVAPLPPSPALTSFVTVMSLAAEGMTACLPASGALSSQRSLSLTLSESASASSAGSASGMEVEVGPEEVCGQAGGGRVAEDAAPPAIVCRVIRRLPKACSRAAFPPRATAPPNTRAPQPQPQPQLNEASPA